MPGSRSSTRTIPTKCSTLLVRRNAEFEGLLTAAGVRWEHVGEQSRTPILPMHLRNALASRRIDILHAHLPLAAGCVALLPRSRPTARVLTHHHGRVIASRGNAWFHADRMITRRFDLIVAPSAAVAEFLRREYGLRDSQLRTILNAWAPPPDESRVIRPSGPPPRPAGQRRRVVCVANFRPEKGHATLLKAFHKVLSDGVRADLLLVGDGPLASSIHSLAEDLGISEHVELRGPASIPEVWLALAESDVFAIASQEETLGIALLEASAARLPVVATRVGGIPEIVADGESGLLVPAGDVSALAGALRKLLSDLELRRKMGEAGRLVAARHRHDVMVAEYARQYTELASS